ncbi:hypothetical protein DH2020_032172 [Rehmannia glutinosa]|uniref:DUF8040 domain-containing protein n=1 Tax=Rehmannia glutinosa TaxID=99300 RepID=A0ABR0VFV7_REHGL
MSDSESKGRLDSLSESSSDGTLDNGMSEEETEDSSSNTSGEKRRKYLHAIIVGATMYYQRYLHKTPCYDRDYSGWASLMSILNGHPRRCHNNFRMHKEVFFELSALLVTNYGLKPMRSVTIEEQLATFMMIVGVREGNRQLQETFQRSGYTISKSFHNVLRACTKMSLDWIKPFSDFTTTPSYIKDNTRYFPHFKLIIWGLIRVPRQGR